MVNREAFTKALATESIHEAASAPEKVNDIVHKAQEAVEVLRTTVAGIGFELENIRPMKKEILEELRSMRMMAATEVNLILSPMKDLRKFFLEKEHDSEMARLREFVDLCERLERLKANGFLDAVADTILKLS